MHNNTAMQFSFKYCEMKCLGNPAEQSFKMAAQYFKRSITAIAVRKRKDVLLRIYFFRDGTTCKYNYAGQYFKFTSPIS